MRNSKSPNPPLPKSPSAAANPANPELAPFPMNRNLFWKFIFFVILPIGLSALFITPPTSRELVVEFNRKAIKRDADFRHILERVQALQKARPDRQYANLQEAIGTNDITRYFPFAEAKTEPHPTTYILNRLQREAAGKIHLGLDLRGGSSFLLEMDTNRLEHASEADLALANAVEVLRKRVDKLGVAEP